MIIDRKHECEGFQKAKFVRCRRCNIKLTAENSPIDELDLFEGYCYDCEHELG